MRTRMLHLLIKPASSLCNLRCRYCFYCDVAENRNTLSYGIMEPQTVDALLRQSFAYATGPITFSFQGGEPTMAGLRYFADFCDKIPLYNTSSLPVQLALQTNGYILDDDWCTFLAEHRFLVGVSLDGTARLHDANRVNAAGEGTFSVVRDAIRRLKSHGVDTNILCVVTDTLARHGAEVYRYFRSQQFPFLQFIPQIPDFDTEGKDTLTAAHYGQFLNTTFQYYYEDFRRGQYRSVRLFDNFVRLAAGKAPECCGMDGQCHANLVVEADGSVYPCDFYVLDKWRMGNLCTDPIETLLQSDTARAFLLSGGTIPEKCRTCPYVALCRGGCRRHREPHFATNRYCEAYRTFFAQNGTKIHEMARLCFG